MKFDGFGSGLKSYTRHFVFGLVMSALLTSSLFAQDQKRPKSEHLLPETTVAYLQIDNVRDFVETLSESTVGQMLADEKIAPLAEELYAQAQSTYDEFETTVGLTLDEIQSLPAGEVCIAIVAPRRKDPCYVVIIDTDEESEAVTKAMDRARELADERGVEIETETTDDDFELEVMEIEGQEVTYLRKQGTILACTNRDVLDDILERWNGREAEKVRPLTKNRKFVTIMNRCRGSKEAPPEMRFFVDPIATARSYFRGNAGAQFALNALPILGLDGLLAIGGSAIMNEQEFEAVTHMHVMLSNPRAGLFEMLALKPGEYQPQTFVPHNITNYMTTSWDMDKFYAELAKIYNTFRGEGQFEEDVQNTVADEIGLDFREDILASFSGRVTFLQWVQDGKRFNDLTQGVALEIGDSEKCDELIESLLDKAREEGDDDNISEEEYKNITIYQFGGPGAERRRERREKRLEERELDMDIRMPEPCAAIIGDHVVFSDSVDFIKRAIETDRGEEPGLGEDNQFEEVSKKMTRLLQSDSPAALMYSRPEESMRMYFNAGKSENSMEMLEKMAEGNERARGFIDAFKDNPLPDFDDVKKYFAPSGAFITSDDTGYHMLGFTLKPDLDAADSDDK